MKNIKNDDRGVTLVEIIISVVILGIIAVPLLRSFLVSAHSSRKSAELAAATIAYQNVVEKIEATGVTALLKDAKLVSNDASFCVKTVEAGGVTYTPYGNAAQNSPDKIYYISIPAVSSGNREFAALVTLDGNTAANSLPVGVGNQIDAGISMTGYDGFAESEYISECTEYDKDGNPVQLLSISDLTRSIKISVAQQNRDAGAKTADYKIEVVFTYKNTEAGFSRSYGSTALVTQVKDSVYGSAAFSLFLFYDAYYKTASNYSEDISIENNYKDYLDFNVFLVNTNGGTAPFGYQTMANYKYQRFDGDKTQVRIFTNLPKEKVSYKAYRDLSWFRSLSVSGYLVEQRADDRRYFINVKLFDAKEGINGSPLLSLDAEKLD